MLARVLVVAVQSGIYMPEFCFKKRDLSRQLKPTDEFNDEKTVRQGF